MLVNSMEVQDPVKKKRGRKPKGEAKPPLLIVDAEQTTENMDSVKKTKRGRKPKFVYSTQDVVGTSAPCSLSDDENIIVRLNVNDDSKTEEVRFDDEHPYAYNRDEYCNLSNVNENLIVGERHETKHFEPSNLKLKIVNLLKDFEEKNKVNEWPSNTSICCYWCCHKFDNAPFGIPVNFANNKFDVFGCFCSLECASAYNFKMHDNIDEMWERFNLINLLSRRLNLGRLVKPSPDRLALKMFGGYMEIDEFRSFFKSNKLVNINFPPMTSITQQIEEVNEHELNNDFKYIPLDQDRIDKYKEKQMFKRTKPLINNKNSLEFTMNLKYN